MAAQPVQSSRISFQEQYSGQRSCVPLQFTSGKYLYLLSKTFYILGAILDSERHPVNDGSIFVFVVV